MTTQAVLEREMRTAGIERARAMLSRNEEKGRAENNPYMQAMYRRYLLPLMEALKEAKAAAAKPGRRVAHLALVEGLDEAVLASVAVREVLNTLLATESHTDVRGVARSIGVTVQREMALQVLNIESPELLWEVQHDLDRRHSKNARHRYNAIAGAARNKEVSLLQWGPADREQLGLFLIEELRKLELVEMELHTEKKFKVVNRAYIMNLTEDARKLVNGIKECVELSMPYVLPFVEPPKDWVAFNDGGCHSMEMRAAYPFAVKNHQTSRHAINRYKTCPELTAKLRSGLNVLQRVPWRINKKLLNAIEEVSQHIDTDEILMQAEVPKPPAPYWLSKEMTKETMTPEQLTEFTSWKRELAEWYTECKLRFTKWGRFGTAMRVARKFAQMDRIYFLYQADFRGRVYAITTGVSPQGSDLQKALIHFADAEPLDTTNAVNWFKVNIANKFGIDKVPHAEQLQWVEDNADFLERIGLDPIANREWLDADCPLQFLAACFEWVEFRACERKGVPHFSRLAVGLDGSCNGLQHFSGMLRDQVGGTATNLVPAERPNDIYRVVADKLQQLLEREDESELTDQERAYRAIWLKHGINRTLVKRSVMTLPYGSTRFSCADFIVQDYLRIGKVPEFRKDQHSPAANYLSHRLWKTIGEVVIAARSAMDYLQSAAVQILNNTPDSQITWSTPTGFEVQQVYQETETIRINSILLGGIRINVGNTSDTPSVRGHKNGLSPNFVHSMDASHMNLVTIACAEEGITSLAMIHDDYGTHARYTQRLFELIRSTFVSMYESCDPLQDFYKRYSDVIPVPPEKGDLDLSVVQQSPYFFT